MAILVNGERVAIVDSSSIRAEGDDSFEVEGNDSSAYYLTELAQVDPKGRWRFHLEDDELKFQKKTSAGWVTFDTFITIDAEGAVLTPSGYQDWERLREAILLEFQQINFIAAVKGIT